MRMCFQKNFLFFVLAWMPLWAVASGPVRDGQVEAELISVEDGLRPGSTALIGLRLLHDPSWHTYWKITATGYAPSIEWDLPDGFEAGEILWPMPKPYETLGFIEYVYEDEIVLPVEIRVPESAQLGESVTFRAVASWLMCTETKCIPGSAELSLTLPISAAPGPARDEWTALFAEAETLRPVEVDGVMLTAFTDESGAIYLFVERADGDLPEDLYFFDAELLIKVELTQTPARPSESTALFRFERDPASTATDDRLRGVLGTSGTWREDLLRRALHVDVPLLASPPERVEVLLAEADLAPSPPVAGGGSIWMILLFAFIGGLILNLMPCVFPIIGIKIMGFVNQAGENRRTVVLHGLVFTLGVLASFWVLAGLLIGLTLGGQELGWGFQLQQPGFNFILIVLLLLFGLNMSGVFEIGESVVGVGSDLTGKSGYSGSFFSGILATVVATPCSAPILGTALGALMALPPAQQFLAFTSMALGLSGPYLFLSAFPRLVQMLPRPGAWMESFKQGMSFLIYGAVAYLIWVLAGQLVYANGFAETTLGVAFAGLILVAAAAWIYGRWGAAYRATKVRRTGYALAVVTLIAGIYLGYPRPFASASEDAPLVIWQEWEPGKAEALAAEGRIVFVDFTARWCVTCQSNKAVVFASDEVRRQFKANEIVALRADWTNHDPRITNALREIGRAAIPVNLFYGPGAEEPLILPELLTPGIVLDRLEQVKRSS
jgi:thiol:disulfide interchange protein/DsbC/DsbD-like thiol-disulfide interchange protein